MKLIKKNLENLGENSVKTKNKFIEQTKAKLPIILIFILFAAIISYQDKRFFGDDFKEKAIVKPYIPELPKINDIKQIAKLNLAEIIEQEKGKAQAAILDANGNQIGRVLQTMPLCQDLIGFSSNIPMSVILDMDNMILDILVHKNSETPSFMKRIEDAGLLKAYRGKHTKEAATFAPDTITRATRSSSCMIQSLNRTISNYENIVAKEIQQSKQNRRKYSALSIFLLLALAACFNVGSLAKYRKFWLFLAVLIPGVIFPSLLSADMLYSALVNGISLKKDLFLIILAFCAFFIPLVFNRNFYCVWYCPFGALQELSNKCVSKEYKIKHKYLKYFKHLRISIFILLLCYFLLGFRLNLSEVEPFSIFYIGTTARSVKVIVLVVLLLALFVPRPWCNYICPLGEALEKCRYKKQEGDSGEKRMSVSDIFNIIFVIAIVVVILYLPKDYETGVQQTMPLIETKGAAKTIEPSQPLNQPILNQSQTVTEKITLSNEVTKNIFARKSVREFKGLPVSTDVLYALVKAGSAAPTAMNVKPWRFVIIEHSHLHSLEGIIRPITMNTAGGAIVVCGDLKIAEEGNTLPFWMLDCAIAAQNILLTAESYSLGAVWNSVYPSDERTANLQKILNLPENVVPLCVIPIGYPLGGEKPKEKYDPSKVHLNTY